MYPKDHLSLITDGMAQNHSQLPYLANLTSITTLQQHLQGVYLHGREIMIYRTFHNVRNGANLQIHTLLLSLEQVILKEGNMLAHFLSLKLSKKLIFTFFNSTVKASYRIQYFFRSMEDQKILQKQLWLCVS